jgi:hypothetical protein
MGNLNGAKRKEIQGSNLTAGRKDAGRRASGGGIALGSRSRFISEEVRKGILG